ncbi:MAG: ATP-dependent sacrificial sulfur transferase LarE [Coriobacteriia bacterium]|nr:ATP-dependent sacrificial sulfur transferase LarE [Coriobacteriia bacterium]
MRAILQSYGSLAISFSGGVDSSLLLDLTHEILGKNTLAITACMAALPARELEAARNFCAERTIRYIEVNFDEFAVAGFSQNPENRCYLCKHALLTTLLATAAEHGISALAEGSNLDDQNDYRPGKAAVEELGVVSPLEQAGFTKADIRTLSKERDLPTWNKPACACLATRLPYNTPLSKELLKRIDTAEQHLLDAGAKQVRVRVHESLARIELDAESIPLFLEPALREHITSQLTKLGFTPITLDLQGYQDK